MQNAGDGSLGVAVDGVDHLRDGAHVLVLADTLLEHVLLHLTGVTGYRQVGRILSVSC